jgi:hypothetical protein
MARGTPGALALGPGSLYWGPLGSTEPTDLTTPWASVDSDWLLLGYTDAGSEFHSQTSTDPVEVAEELQELADQETGRAESLVFSLAELTATHLKVAFNGGTLTTGTGIVTFEPPDLGSTVAAMLGWQAEDNTERWVYRQCKQDGEIVIPRGKGSAKALIPCSFKVQKPATGLKAWKAILATPLRQ